MALLLRLELCRVFAGIVIFAVTGAGDGHAADLTVTSAKIQAGRLVITGTTVSPRIRVRLDGQTAAPFNVMSSLQRTFAFSLVYHPGDCIVTLQKLTPPSTLGPAVRAVVADCGPRGLLPRGTWNGTIAYAVDDIVVLDGSSWRAKVNNSNRRPPNVAYWEQFTAKGAQGEAGQPGPAGPQGPPGAGAGGAYADSIEVNGTCEGNAWIALPPSQYMCAVSCPEGYFMADSITRTVSPLWSEETVSGGSGSNYGSFHSSLIGLYSQLVLIGTEEMEGARAALRGVCIPLPPLP